MRAGALGLLGALGKDAIESATPRQEPPLFLFHAGVNALLAPHPADPTKRVAYPIGLLRQARWHVDEIAMRRLPRFSGTMNP